MGAVFTHRSEVTRQDIELPTLASEADPTAPGLGVHLMFDRILRRCGIAWSAYLLELGVGLEGMQTIVPRIEADYLTEVGVGLLEVDVVPVSVGRTSFRLHCTVRQDGRDAASVHVVFVSFDYDEREPRPLTHEQRVALSAGVQAQPV
jgi:acyl-CoA thioesterase FadM